MQGKAPYGYCCVSIVASTRGAHLPLRAICRTAMWIKCGGFTGGHPFVTLLTYFIQKTTSGLNALPCTSDM